MEFRSVPNRVNQPSSQGIFAENKFALGDRVGNVSTAVRIGEDPETIIAEDRSVSNIRRT